jgi:hypothetical protein
VATWNSINQPSEQPVSEHAPSYAPLVNLRMDATSGSSELAGDQDDDIILLDSDPNEAPAPAGSNSDQTASISQRGQRNRFRGKDPIVAPSKESGGVPEPTTTYLQTASLPSAMLPEPKHILVVMDLNGTLLHRPNRKQPKSFRERPFARAFLEYCVKTFKLVVWSSARPENVSAMCDALLNKDLRGNVVAVWGRDRFGLSLSDYNIRVQCYKRLTTVWSDPLIRASHPDAANGGCWDQTNTVLVDDSLEKARSEPHNFIQVPEFAGDIDETGCILPQVHEYLNVLCSQENISSYIAGSPFKMDPDFRLG